MDRPQFRRAAHEAGHVLVGAAVGRRPVRVRIESRRIAENDPHVKYLGTEAMVGGSTLFETGLLDEINQRVSTKKPLELHHVDWLRADLVMTMGGFLAEEQLLGDIGDSSADGDMIDAANTAARLGFKSDSDDGGARLDAAIAIAREILQERATQLVVLAQAFACRHADFDQSALDELLRELGVVLGSHRSLLDRPAAEAST